MSRLLKYAFRITHIDNIPHILKNGIVKYDSPLRDEHFVSIGDRKVIELRGERQVKGYLLNDYIPFYFGPRSPMLYVIQHGFNGVERVTPEKIVYCVIKLDDLIKNQIDCIFTDGHALSNLTSVYTKDCLPRISDIINYDDVYSTYWNVENDIDLKRRKEAELLIKNDLPVQYICGYVVYNDETKEQLIRLGIAEEMIAVANQYYF